MAYEFVPNISCTKLRSISRSNNVCISSIFREEPKCSQFKTLSQVWHRNHARTAHSWKVNKIRLVNTETISNLLRDERILYGSQTQTAQPYPIIMFMLNSLYPICMFKVFIMIDKTRLKTLNHLSHCSCCFSGCLS